MSEPPPPPGPGIRGTALLHAWKVFFSCDPLDSEDAFTSDEQFEHRRKVAPWRDAGFIF